MEKQSQDTRNAWTVTMFYSTNNHLFFTHLAKITVYCKGHKKVEKQRDVAVDQVLGAWHIILRDTTHCESSFSL